ncbi:MAG TPA: bifunctional 5,10-methylenetetrahydrofolate dehydrogenase/5,10-methenyltetrahydrofolate cyclohydrolase [Dehalococcoidia bacterium]|nr:bifunctional 5,10-methylenetetrahydrofolate dehydrogenase/5,10-methenyltetrahydrofolate cyclohydrolase [Dehalococcoidia bacterium]
MSAEIIDCKQIAKTIKRELTTQGAKLAGDGLVPRLAIILVGDDAPSAAYVRGKERDGAEVGIATDVHRLAGDGDPDRLTLQIRDLIDRLNLDYQVHGIILQLPVPQGVDEDMLLASIDPRKDVDGLHPENQGLIVQGRPRYLPATPHAVQQILVRAGHAPGGKHVVIVGRSRLVGLPLANMLIQKRAGGNATVTICHTATLDLPGYVRAGDIVIAAAGQPELITGEMVRPGAIVIDVGINRVDDATRERGYRLVGDVEHVGVRAVARAVTPVPGGVGLMTRVMLLTNVVRAARESLRR